MNIQDESFKQFLENEEFLEGLLDAKNPEELAVVLKANNIELPEGETIEMAFDAVQAHKTDELTEDDLEEVAGGVIITASVAACYVVSCALIGFFAGYGYASIKGGSKKKKKK